MMKQGRWGWLFGGGMLLAAVPAVADPLPRILDAVSPEDLISEDLRSEDLPLSLGEPRFFERYWRAEQGLPQVSVRAIVQGPQGYLWLGTEEGLARFDGLGFQVYDVESQPQLIDNRIEDLLADESGLWIATRSGVSRLEGGRFVGYTPEHGLAADHNQVLFRDSQQHLWIGGRGGLSRWTPKGFERFRLGEHDLDNDVGALLETRDGDLWVGTRRGLLRFSNLDPGQGARLYDESDGLSHRDVRALLQDRAGRLWVGTIEGIDVFEQGRFRKLETGEATGLVWDLAEIGNHLWAATREGLLRWAAGDGASGEPSFLIEEVDLRALFFDGEDNLWIGSRFEGLLRFRQARVGNVGSVEGLAEEVIWGTHQDSAGDLWVGTRNGLNRIRPDGTIDHWLAGRTVQSVFASEGAVWVGTATGLLRWADGELAPVTLDGRPLGNVFSTFVDRSGHVWIGTDADGVYRIHPSAQQSDPSRFSAEDLDHFTTVDGWSADKVRVFFEDADGELWLGSDSGLIQWRGGSIRRFPAPDGLERTTVLDIYGDRPGRLWLATAAGLSLFQDGDWRLFKSDQGMPARIVMRVIEDDQKRLFMSTNRGISAVDKEALLALAEGALDRVEPLFFSESDGMRSRECNGGVQPAGWRTSDGRLWFPTIRGLAVIDPARLQINAKAPPVVLERFSADREALPLATPAVLPAETRELEFHFTTLSFVEPEKNRFRYRLDGFDDEWVDAGHRRAAFYTNLEPGHYRFRVLGANNDGIWAEQSRDYSFQIRPAFYQTPAFHLAVLLLVASVGWCAHRLRLKNLLERQRARSLEAQNAELERFSSSVAHDLKSPLVTLRGFLELVQEDATAGDGEQLSRDVAQMNRAMDRMQGLLDDLSELSQSGRLQSEIRPVDLVEPAKEAGELVAGRLSAGGVELSISHDLPTVLGDRRRLRQVFQNLIDNGVKFIGAQERPKIEVGCRPGTDPVILFVRDNGVGIDPKDQERIFEPFDRLDPEAEGTGLGLALVRRTIAAHGGRIWVESAGKGHGSTFYFTLPSSHGSPIDPSSEN